MTKANKEEFVLAAVRALGTCGQRKNTVGPLPNWRDAHYGRLQPPEELELLVVGLAGNVVFSDVVRSWF